ncbi:hypothetical protein F5I97DRAFT_1831636 [Phlebopus sp. FC_14]|nr:hypothetical protein F5I97DRAFT_1831636 [Phlebopus sp. FC_14]
MCGIKVRRRLMREKASQGTVLLANFIVIASDITQAYPCNPDAGTGHHAGRIQEDSGVPHAGSHRNADRTNPYVVIVVKPYIEAFRLNDTRNDNASHKFVATKWRDAAEWGNRSGDHGVVSVAESKSIQKAELLT